MLGLGRARHVASAERSCRTQQAGQAEPGKDIKREADGGVMEVLQRQRQITPSPRDTMQEASGGTFLGLRTI